MLFNEILSLPENEQINIDLTDMSNLSVGYEPDENCVARKENSQLDTTDPEGASVSSTDRWAF